MPGGEGRTMSGRGFAADGAALAHGGPIAGTANGKALGDHDLVAHVASGDAAALAEVSATVLRISSCSSP